MTKVKLVVEVVVVDDHALGEILSGIENGDRAYFQVRGYGCEVVAAEEAVR